ncbi:c-type cytochrome biogenesis protein CcmI [Profundibacter amoris]|uniref:C-type cytochrome biogenesis protein CcmI n=1 Tax=Profundibacter amoris TaxID=2171755 RepID=A0A347UF88_9RHOB|nr:c-type cytochrome biogenesis protein CcmI [Profundibacter amoris]AXX97516.1 c-type cytochrome biogenesis protein CcmI [Profundibacter amoris]
MVFWIVIGVLILVVAALLALALLRGRDTGVAAAEYDLQVYRDQLAGVERDLERGVVSKEEAARIKTEVSRRILDTDKALQAAEEVHRAPKAMTYGAILASLVLLAASVGVYQKIGAPGYPDLPLKLRIAEAEQARESRPSQAEIEAQVPPMAVDVDPRQKELVAKLRTAVAARPDDLKGHELLAGNEAALGNYTAAYRAHQRVIEIKGADATADDYADLADLMIVAAGGYVSPEAEGALKKALTLDPENGKALYYSGLMFAQNGRPDVTFRIWKDLLEASNPNDPWMQPIIAQIEDAAAFAGVDYRVPPMMRGGGGLAGPDAGAVAAASEMTAEERQDMIQNMVSQLSERLASEGGSAQEWAQLIGALGVLGDKDRAARIWGEAQQVFAGDSAALETVQAAAVRAGVAE